MENVVLERVLSGPAELCEVIGHRARTQVCLDLHGINYEYSFISPDATRLTCRFSAPDAESLRIAMRQAKVKYRNAWSATIHPTSAAALPALHDVVVVERSFAQPVAFEDIQGAEDAARWCLDKHDVAFLNTYFSIDRRRMLCFYRAPDAEAVRAAQRQAGLPFDVVWSATGYSVAMAEQALASFLTAQSR